MDHAHSYTPQFIERFWARVEKTQTCWIWKGGTSGSGYGQLRIQRKLRQKSLLAHRVAWVLSQTDPIPPSIQVLHRCDNPRCVNPDHLFLGTQYDNMQDMIKKGRLGQRAYRPTHCKRGHSLTPGNLYLYFKPDGRSYRKCRTCSLMRARGII